MSMPRRISENDPIWLLAFIMAAAIPFGLVWSRALAEIATSIVGISFLIHSWRAKDWRWVKDPFVRITIAAWLWTIGISPFAVDVYHCYVNALPWFRYVLLFIALHCWVLQDNTAIKWLACLVAGLLAFVALDTLWQYATEISLTGHRFAEGGRLTGPMGNPKVGIFLAKLALPIFAACLYFAWQANNKFRLLLCAVLFSGIIATTLFSGERSAFIGISFNLFLIGGLMAIKYPRWRMPLVVSAVVFGAGVIALFLHASWVNERLTALYVTITHFKDTPYAQLLHAAREIGAAHLFAGAGLGGFRLLCPALLQQSIVGYCDLHPHNPYLEWYAEAGVPGLLFFVGMVVMLFCQVIRPIRHKSGFARFFQCVFLSMCIINFFPFMFTQSFFSNWPAILMWYGLGVAIALKNIGVTSPLPHK